MQPDYIVGIDEVGRGPLAGPIVLCALAINTTRFNLDVLGRVPDSKKMSVKKREEWVKKIDDLKSKDVLDYGLSFVSNGVIDRIGITTACKIAISRCLSKIKRSDVFGFIAFDHENAQILLDGGLRAPKKFTNQRTIIRGDESETVIALASIVAKVARDAHMVRVSGRYPEYGFDRHKGYGTRSHYLALVKYGPTPIHRKTFL